MRKNWMLGGLLVAITIIGPMVAYAGVSIVYPGSEHSLGTTTGPIVFGEGDDYAPGLDVGFFGSAFDGDGDPAMTLTVNGLPGGTLTVDEYATITANADVTSHKLEIADDLDNGGTLAPAEIDTLKIRVWSGTDPPSADNEADADTTVCAVLDLTDTVGTETTGTCSGTNSIQLIMSLDLLAAGTNAVSIRPSSIVLT